MHDDRIPEDVMYRELETGSRPYIAISGRLQTWLDDGCIPLFQATVHSQKHYCGKRKESQKVFREKKSLNDQHSTVAHWLLCNSCAKDCHSRTSLFSRCRRCSMHTQLRPQPGTSIGQPRQAEPSTSSVTNTDLLVKHTASNKVFWKNLTDAFLLKMNNAKIQCFAVCMHVTSNLMYLDVFYLWKYEIQFEQISNR